jgi:hypothetical protein
MIAPSMSVLLYTLMRFPKHGLPMRVFGRA